MDPNWVSAVFNGIMAVVWIAYLNVFLREFKSHYRARLFIQLHGRDVDAPCVLVNMSDKAVSIASVQLRLRYDKEEDGNDRVVDVTNAGLLRDTSSAGVPAALRSAEFVNLGGFGELVALACDGRQHDGPVEGLPEGLCGVEVRGVIQHGASDHPGAVCRSFAVERDGAKWLVTPDGGTRMWYSRRGRRLAETWMQASEGKTQSAPVAARRGAGLRTNQR